MATGPLKQVASFSGGADSTAMIYAMLERGEQIDGLLVTPTGNEPADVWAHWNRVADDVGAPAIVPPGPSLEALMGRWNTLPNNRMRFCTRLTKIQPLIAWAKQNPGVVFCVGLRADEAAREGIISNDVTERRPLQEYGMRLPHVRGLLARRGIDVPRRTDCRWCYEQRLAEWYELWRDDPEGYAEGERWEARTDHTFRSAFRDSWPAGLAELRELFERGVIPTSSINRLRAERDGARQLLLDVLEQDEPTSRCRICTL